MEKRRISLVPLLLVAALVFTLTAVAGLERGKKEQDILQLEQALHRTAVACYAVEGIYPPNVAYMQETYGLQYDENRFVVHYDLFASNFMPDITVMERSHE